MKSFLVVVTLAITLVACNKAPQNSSQEKAFVKNAISEDLSDIQCTKIKTGFMLNVNPITYRRLYIPVVLTKWKNISDRPVSAELRLGAIFLSNGEEWARTSMFVLYSKGWEAPLQPGISKQAALESSTGYVNGYSIYNAKVTCLLTVNDIPFDTVQVENRLLTSNRIQSSE